MAAAARWAPWVVAYATGVAVCWLAAPNPDPKPLVPAAPTRAASAAPPAALCPRPRVPSPAALPAPPSPCACRARPGARGFAAASASTPPPQPADGRAGVGGQRSGAGTAGAPLPHVHCRDDLGYMRDAAAPKSAVLARCALHWMAAHVATLFQGANASVFDPAYDGLNHPLVNATGPQWLHLTALLPHPGVPLPARRVVPYQQVVLAPPSAHRLASLLVTNSLFDVFLALRLDELLDLPGVPDLLSLLGRLVAMAKQTFVLLPCARRHAAAVSGGGRAVVKAAVARAMAQAKEMGVLYLDVVVQPLVQLTYGGCSRELLRVRPTKLHRGVRLKWCYYPLGPKYDLVYRDQEWVQLVHRYVIQYTRASGDKVKSIRKWKPSMNLADVLGWGLGRARREVILWDMLRIGSCPDPAVQNWLLTSGGLVERIDANQQMIPNAHPQGRDYVQFLQLLTCVDRWANQTWKQVDTYEGLAHQTQAAPTLRFIHTRLFAQDPGGSAWRHYEYADPVQSNDQPDCPDCNTCLRHQFHITKMFRHTERSLPPAACHACWRCKRDRLLGPGVPLDLAAEGCTDVEGVDGHGAARREFCDETQEQAIMRPSTRALKERFEAKGMKLRPEMLADP